MTNPALSIIEEAYDIALNPAGDYFAQLEPLAPNGELANRITANKILFKLCQLVDKQAQQIKALQDDRVAIAQKILDLEGKINPSTVTIPMPDPTQPLDEPPTHTTGSDTDTTV